MFETEIMNKCVVDVYDTRMIKLFSGIITGYREKTNCIVINHRVCFPLRHLAKIAVRPSPIGASMKKAHS